MFKWLPQAEIDEGGKPGVSRGDSAELREARKRLKFAGAGERGPAARGGIFVRRRTCRERLYPIVTELAPPGSPSR